VIIEWKRICVRLVLLCLVINICIGVGDPIIKRVDLITIDWLKPATCAAQLSVN